MVHLPRVEATLAPLALLTKTVYLPWIKLQQPDARLIRLSEKNNNWTFNLASSGEKDPNAQPSSWSFRLDNILFDRGRIAIDDKVSKADVEILVDPLGKPLPFSEVTGTKAKGDNASAGDYVFGLRATGRYNGQPLTGTGKIGGMLALRSAGTPFPVQADFRSGNTRVAFTGTVNDPMNMGGVDLRLKFAGDSLGSSTNSPACCCRIRRRLRRTGIWWPNSIRKNHLSLTIGISTAVSATAISTVR